MNKYQPLVLFGIIHVLIFSSTVSAQMKRERVVKDGPVESVFKAPKLVVFNTTKNTDENNLHMMIQHSFGPIESLDNAQNLWGLDGTANIRISLDYGITDKWSVGIGRTKKEKAFDFRTKYNFLEQTRSGKVPISAAIDATVGIRTDEKPDFSISDQLFAGFSIPISRKVSEDLSLMLYPSAAWFGKTEFIGMHQSLEQFYYGLGLAGRYKVSKRSVVTVEGMPVFSEGIRTVMSLGWEIETGSHVFQVFLTTSEFYTDPYMLRYATNMDGDFLNHVRIGFNVNRLFWFN